MATATVMERPSLYEELGGAAAIEAVVDVFYDRVLADETLQSTFVGIDLERLRRHQARFMSFALGGPNEYAGRSMRRAHTGLGITEAHFGAVAGHLSAALAICGAPPDKVDAVISLVATLKDDIVGQ